MPPIIPIQVRFAPADAARIDDYRRRLQNPPSRPKALEQLARIGLEVIEKRQVIQPADSANKLSIV